MKKHSHVFRRLLEFRQRISSPLKGLLWGLASLATLPTAAQIVGNDVFLKGTYTEVGMSQAGSFGSEGSAPTGYHPNAGTQLGFVADAAQDGWTTGTPPYNGDFFVPGDPEEGWGLTINGINYNNALIARSSSFNIPGSVTGYSAAGGQLSATWSGSVAGLAITQQVSFPTNALYFLINVSITNTTAATIPAVYYMRNVDPDNEQRWTGSFDTRNTIAFQPPSSPCNKALAEAVGLTYGMYVGLGTKDPRARATFGGFANRSAQDIWNGTGFSQTGTNTYDEAISLAFNIGNIAPGQTQTLAYVYILNQAQLDLALTATTSVTTTTSASRCGPGSVTLMAAGAPAGSTYSWYANAVGGPVVGTGASFLTPSLTNTTIYYVDTAPVPGCSRTPATATVNLLPNVAIAPAAPHICPSQSVSLTASGGVTYSWSPATGLNTTVGATVIATPAATTTYTVTSQSAAGCTKTQTVTVSVDVPTAPASVQATPATLTLGQTTTLSVGNVVSGHTYTWTGPGLNATTGSSVTATPLVAGTSTYQVSATNGTNCTSTAASVSVMVLPLAPTISSFTPTSGPVGTTVTVTGANLAGATAVRVNGTPGTITTSSATSLTFTVGVGSTTGLIGITTPGGAASSTGAFTVTGVGLPAPTIVSCGCTLWTAPIGTPIILYGTNLTGATSVNFGGVTVPASGFTVNAAGTAITVIVPPGATAGPITVTCPGGVGTSPQAFTPTAPLTTGPVLLACSHGYGSPGSVVVLRGLRFAATGSVIRFNGVAATGTVYNTPTQLTATVPFGATSGPLTLTVPGGQAGGSLYFEVTTPPAPTISNFSPKKAPEAALVSLTGTNFSGVTAVRFGTVNASGFVVNSTTSLTVPVPPGADNDRIYVLANGGMAQTAQPFTLINLPTLSDRWPAYGTPGALVILTGTNLTNASSVTFGGGIDAVTYTVNSASQITATIPAGAVTGPISVTTVAGTASSASFTVNATPLPPTVTSFTPVIGPIGRTVVMTGTRLSGASIRFNQTPAVVTANQATSVTTTVPTSATTGKLSILTAGGLAQSATNFTVVPIPVIQSIAPAAGSPGSVVELTGTGLGGATAVVFGGGVSATTFTSTSSRVTVTVPGTATTGSISVTTPGGTSASTSFTVTSPPTPIISGFTPNSGPAGTNVTVTGSNFFGINLTSGVRLNDVPMTNVSVAGSGLSLSGTVPAGAVTGKLSILASGGFTQSATNFTVIPPPTITALLPEAGTRGSTVVIQGTNLGGATVRFNGFTAAAGTLNASATQLTLTVPLTATTGSVTVTTVAGTATSPSPFTVTTPPPPTIAVLSPVSGIVGSALTLTGANFVNVTRVLVNGKAAESFLVTGTTSLRVTVPAGATTGSVAVIAEGGMGVSTGVYTVILPPDIDTFSPVRGPIDTEVTLKGTGFANAIGVKFNGTPGTIVSNSATELVAKVLAGSTPGQVSITTAIGTGVSPGSFLVLGSRDGAPIDATADETTAAMQAKGWQAYGYVADWLAVYPNPVNARLTGAAVTIALPAWTEAQGARPTAVLYDGLGREVRTVKLPATGPAVTTMPLTGLVPGVYSLRCGGQAVKLLLD